MMRYALALVCACALAGVQPYAAADDGQSTPEPTPTPAAPTCTSARHVYALDHWRQAHPARGTQVCPAPRPKIQRLRQRFADYRLYRSVAPYHAPFGHGPRSPADGRWWAKPWQVICGESHGDFYVNADGGYQMIPGTWRAHGGLRFAPTAGAATPLEQHIIAHRAAIAGEPWYGWGTDCG